MWYRMVNVKWQHYTKTEQYEKKSINVYTSSTQNWISHCMRRICLPLDILGLLYGNKEGRKQFQVLDWIMEKWIYTRTKI